MALGIQPPVEDAEARAVGEALARAAAPLEPSPPAYDSPWRRASAREAVATEPEDEVYAARSPRSTRGATSA